MIALENCFEVRLRGVAERQALRAHVKIITEIAEHVEVPSRKMICGYIGLTIDMRDSNPAPLRKTGE